MSEQDDFALILKAAKWAVYQYDTPKGELGPAIARLESGEYVLVRRDDAYALERAADEHFRLTRPEDWFEFRYRGRFGIEELTGLTGALERVGATLDAGKEPNV